MNTTEPHESTPAPPRGAALVLTRGTGPTAELAAALADRLDGRVRTVPPGASAPEFLRELDDPAVAIGVIDRDTALWPVLGHASKPIAVTPNRSAASIDRILVPLDGTPEAAGAVAETVRLFRTEDTEIIVLHVFDRSTVPAYWDQAAHARAAWEEEFLARYCAPNFPASGRAFTLRSGTAGDTVVDVARSDADLIILGWSRRLEPGRAETLRRIVSDATVPVIVVPMASTPVALFAARGSDRHRGPR